jgi:hypothetical protein
VIERVSGFLEAVKFEADRERSQKVVAAAYRTASASDAAINGPRPIGEPFASSTNASCKLAAGGLGAAVLGVR